MDNVLKIELGSIFEPDKTVKIKNLIDSDCFSRTEFSPFSGGKVVIDKLPGYKASCCFFQMTSKEDTYAEFFLTGEYSFLSCKFGGVLLQSNNSSDRSSYWIPQESKIRVFDKNDHILFENPAEIFKIACDSRKLSIVLKVFSKRSLEFVVWKLPPYETELCFELENISEFECKPNFLWSSHTSYRKPSDIYLHIINGFVYENQMIWPKYWKICSELDAHALYVTLNGLEIKTGKKWYDLLKKQLLYSIISRQSADGGWYHGEWTDDMESHFRLHCGGIHLLLDAYEENKDKVVLVALQKAVNFIVNQKDETEKGAWFLHDSLEKSEEDLNKYPFSWKKNRLFGKSATNLLVLNTHLDTSMALERYSRLTGDRQYKKIVKSAQKTTHAVLSLNSANVLYKIIFKIIKLTILPEQKAKQLPLPLRAVKRIGWKYLIPRLHYVKSIFPRLVMPGGYIDRALSLKSFSHEYQTVNIWDLIRYQSCFSDDSFEHILIEALEFTQNSGIREYWKESKEKQHALGFWVEALYRLCLLNQNKKYIDWLAMAIIDLEDIGIGLPPSLLGGNGEAVPFKEQSKCPLNFEENLSVANLSYGRNICVLIVNSTESHRIIKSDSESYDSFSWVTKKGKVENHSFEIKIHSREWVFGTYAQEKV